MARRWWSPSHSFLVNLMPFKASDATRHTKKAKSPKAKRQFAHVANSMMERGFSEGRSIRAANSVVKNRGRGRKKRGRTSGRS